MIRLSVTAHIDSEIVARVDTDSEAMKLAEALILEKHPGATIDYRSLETVDDDESLAAGTARFAD